MGEQTPPAGVEHEILSRLADGFATLTQLVRHGSNKIDFAQQLTRLEAVAQELDALLAQHAGATPAPPPPPPATGGTTGE